MSAGHRPPRCSTTAPANPANNTRATSACRRRRQSTRTHNMAAAVIEYFLALRDGRPVGRISAQVDDNFQRFQENRWGWFGFFECEEDPEAARALLDRAEQWLRGQGCDRMVGPADFTTNDECGVLLEGHERTPLILSPVDPPLLPGAARGRRRGEGDGPAHVGAAHHRPRQGQPGDLEARRPGRAALRRGRAPVPQARHPGGDLALHGRSTTRPGRRTGASCR